MAFRSVLIRWRVRDVVGDTTADSDVSPDPIPLPDGTTVTLKPAPMELAAPTSVPPITYYPQTINCRFNSDGDLVGPVDSNGDLVNPTVIGVAVVDPNDGDLQPHGWTIGVSVTVPGKRAPVSFNATLMTSEAPDPADTGNPDQLTVYWLTRNSPVPAYAGTATDASVYAAAAAGSASDAAASAASVQRGLPGGVAALDSAGLVPVEQVPDLSARASRSASASVLYQPSSTSLVRWRAIRGEVLAGSRQGHIVVLGDSIPFGAAETGASLPKYAHCWVGQFRHRLDQIYGPGGTGVVIANANIRANPTYDDRFTYTAVADQAFGFFKAACFKLAGGGAAKLEFDATCDQFVIYALRDTGSYSGAAIDGGVVQTFANAANSATSDLPIEAGYAPYHYVVPVDAGSQGDHSLTITPPTNVSFATYIVGVEGRISTPGTFRVSNCSISGKSLAAFDVSDLANGLYGLPMIDMVRPDLLVLALGINDWQGQDTIANVKANLVSVIQRQRATGTTELGGIAPGGDVVMLWNSEPDITALGGGSYTNPSWDQYRDAYYEVADDQDVALIDLGSRWKDFATGDALGLFADTIHPSDKGAGDIAGSVQHALFTEC